MRRVFWNSKKPNAELRARHFAWQRTKAESASLALLTNGQRPSGKYHSGADISLQEPLTRGRRSSGTRAWPMSPETTAQARASIGGRWVSVLKILRLFMEFVDSFTDVAREDLSASPCWMSSWPSIKAAAISASCDHRAQRERLVLSLREVMYGGWGPRRKGVPS